MGFGTSRGASEWSKSKDLYMGSHIFVGECSNFKKIPTHTQDHGDA